MEDKRFRPSTLRREGARLVSANRVPLMGSAIGQVLPTAVGVALSPLPIVAVVFLLVTENGHANGPAFLVGWLLGLAIICEIVLSIASDHGATDYDKQTYK